jgi:hypothetical protein
MAHHLHYGMLGVEQRKVDYLLLLGLVAEVGPGREGQEHDHEHEQAY